MSNSRIVVVTGHGPGRAMACDNSKPLTVFAARHSQAHLASLQAPILPPDLVTGSSTMEETGITLGRVRQVAIDGLMVLGLVVLLAVELPL